MSVEHQLLAIWTAGITAGVLLTWVGVLVDAGIQKLVCRIKNRKKIRS